MALRVVQRRHPCRSATISLQVNLTQPMKFIQGGGGEKIHANFEPSGKLGHWSAAPERHTTSRERHAIEPRSRVGRETRDDWTNKSISGKAMIRWGPFHRHKKKLEPSRQHPVSTTLTHSHVIIGTTPYPTRSGLVKSHGTGTLYRLGVDMYPFVRVRRRVCHGSGMEPIDLGAAVSERKMACPRHQVPRGNAIGSECVDGTNYQLAKERRYYSKWGISKMSVSNWT